MPPDGACEDCKAEFREAKMIEISEQEYEELKADGAGTKIGGSGPVTDGVFQETAHLLGPPGRAYPRSLWDCIVEEIDTSRTED